MSKASQFASPKTIGVIGGGWAGCAAAVELARTGHRVVLFEAARTLGGRARAVELEGQNVDNGQHIMLGAYRDTLKLMQTTGIDTSQVLLRLPLQMRYPEHDDGMDFVTPRLPAPLHVLVALLRTRGLSWQDKLALARFSTTARWMDWRLHQDCSVAGLLERYDQTDRLIRLMWRPLCIAALNTPPERASAQVFLNVLRDSLGASRAASEMLIPRCDLSALFPVAAGNYVQSRGGALRLGCRIRRIHFASGKWTLELENANMPDDLPFDALVVATSASIAAELLAGLEKPPAIPAFSYEPITTCYLQYDAEISLPHAFFALRDEPAESTWGQFVFDRGQLTSEQPGLLAVVVSASTDAIAEGHEALCKAVAQQLANAFQDSRLAQPHWAKAITEKRATFACEPGLARPDGKTHWDSLQLAGDYIQSDYPATIEAAVRSGLAAAHRLR